MLPAAAFSDGRSLQMAAAGLLTCILMGFSLDVAVRRRDGNSEMKKRRDGYRKAGLLKNTAEELLLPCLIMSFSVIVMLIIMGIFIVKTNPMTWMGDFLARDSFLCSKICAYWLTLIIFFAAFAQYTCHVLKWRQIIVRKIFHAAVLALFVPVLLLAEAQPRHTSTLHSFISLALAVMLCIFILIEYCRVFLPFQSSAGSDPISAYYGLFLDERDRGKRFIFSHLFLVVGVAIPIWLTSLHIAIGDDASSNSEKWMFARHFCDHVGLITVGAGDAIAATIGSAYGRMRWSRLNGRTIEGSCAMLCATYCYALLLYTYESVAGNPPLVTSYDKYWPAVAISLAGATVAEAFTSQNDNVVLPLTAMILAIGTLWACYD